jgi:YkoY family integral membrane protein
MLEQIIDSPLSISLKTPLLLVTLVALEAVLSADNAIALAAIARGLESGKMQRSALNLGLVVAYLFRITLILTATLVIQFWQFQFLGAAYLLWLVFNYFTSQEDEKHHHHSLRFTSLWQVVPLIAITDLAFSLDSVTAAIALADDIWLVLLGGAIGVLTLRFLAELFIRWLKVFNHLEDAGFITVGLVGLRLLLRAINPDWVPPEWLMFVAMAVLFSWGFSQRNQTQEREPATGNE